jgi:hypothetical protein
MRRVPVAALIASAVVACGSAATPAATPTASPTPIPTQTATPNEATRAGAIVLDDALLAVVNAHSFEVKIAATDQEGPLAIDAHYAGPSSVMGTMTRKQQVGDFVASGGNVYLHGRGYIGVISSPAFAAKVGDRWFVLHPGDYYKSLGQFVDPAAFRSCITGSIARVANGGVQTQGGGSVIVLTDAGDASHPAATYWVAASGTPYLLHIEMTLQVGTVAGPCRNGNDDSMSGRVTFDFMHIGEAVTVTVPTDIANS